jgi:hypothetical protein
MTIHTKIGTYSGVPMTETVIGKLPDGSPHVAYGEEIPPPRDLTSGEFFQLVKKEAGFVHWPEALSLKQTQFCSARDSVELVRAEGKKLFTPKLITLCHTTYFRSFCRRYVNGLTLEIADTVPLALDQVSEDIRDAVKAIAEGVKKFIAAADVEPRMDADAHGLTQIKEVADAEAA